MDKKLTSQAFAKRLTANEIKVTKTYIDKVQTQPILGYRFNTDFIGDFDSKEDCKVEDDPEGRR